MCERGDRRAGGRTKVFERGQEETGGDDQRINNQRTRMKERTDNSKQVTRALIGLGFCFSVPVVSSCVVGVSRPPIFDGSCSFRGLGGEVNRQSPNQGGTAPNRSELDSGTPPIGFDSIIRPWNYGMGLGWRPSAPPRDSTSHLLALFLVARIHPTLKLP